MVFDVRELTLPIVGAPMAGGPSTPELAAAVTNAGGLGFLAAGYKTAEQFAAQVAAARKLTSGPIGVNLFVMSANQARSEDLEAYRRELEDEAKRYGAAVGEPRWDNDAWEDKLRVVMEQLPDVVSFTFGCPDAGTLRALNDRGVVTAVTVTSAAEARIAEKNGALALVVQGPEAGGHRGTFDADADPDSTPLLELLAEVARTTDLPLIAGGGVATRQDAAAVVDAGAAAVQLGTALLLAEEAGTNPVNRAALVDPAFTETATTRAFTGRVARGLRNRFMDSHPTAPAAYPQVHYMTSPLRAAAAARGDAQGVHLWAGTGFSEARQAPAAEILAELAP